MNLDQLLVARIRRVGERNQDARKGAAVTGQVQPVSMVGEQRLDDLLQPWRITCAKSAVTSAARRALIWSERRATIASNSFSLVLSDSDQPLRTPAPRRWRASPPLVAIGGNARSAASRIASCRLSP